MKKLLLFALSFSFALVQGQSRRVSKSSTNENQNYFSNEIAKVKQFSPNGIVRCATVEYNNHRKLNGKAVSDQVFEDWLAPKIQEIKKLRQARMLPSVIRIPVVVHVIHNGDAIGTGENIADGQVLSQIQVFNEDYRKLTGTPGDGAGVDTTIEFCLAQVDPNGNPTNGIDRVNLFTASYTSMAAIESAKASTIWDPTKYLNCWTFRFGGTMSDILGYAQFPTGSGLQGMPADNCFDDSGSGASTDGVVCNFNTWGSRTIFPAGTYGGTQYDKGRTMTHEVGHMLGLRHTWGDGGCTVDDFCADTPNCDSDFYAGPPCNAPIQCGNPRQIENYMDYSDDGCMNIFTQDQKDRMLAVMMNSPRRDDLLHSNVCDAIPNTPYIQFKREACLDRQPKSVIEGNGCSYTEFSIPLSIDMAPTQNAIVTFSIDPSSGADLGDIQIITPSVTFNAGSTADQNLVFRVLNDNAVESDEELMITFSVNANGGNATENPKGNVYSLTIINDDSVVAANSNINLFYDDFSDGDASDWTILDNNAEPNDDWFLAEETNWPSPFGIYTDYFMASYSWNGVDYSPDNFLSTPAINIPAGASNIQLDYFAGSGSDPAFFSESYQVWVSTSIGSAGNIMSGTLLVDTTIPAVGGAYYNFSIPSSYAGQTVYVSFRHYNTTGEWVLGVDEVEVSADVTISVQTAVDMVTAGQTNLSGSGLSNFTDSSNGNIIGGVQINDASNYGCTNMYVSSAGTGATQYGGSTNLSDYRMDKQFTVVPSNVVAGNSTITFYFTEAEIAGWEAATGNSRTALYVEKDNGSKEVQACSIGAFGTDVTLTATFATGIDGVYSFARQQILSNESFELTGVTLYPNPNNGSFNLGLNASSDVVKIQVFDTRGRLILNKEITGNGIVNESINLNSAQSGVYLVNIQDGSRKVTKKIIVE